MKRIKVILRLLLTFINYNIKLSVLPKTTLELSFPIMKRFHMTARETTES